MKGYFLAGGDMMWWPVSRLVQLAACCVDVRGLAAPQMRPARERTHQLPEGKPRVRLASLTAEYSGSWGTFRAW